MRADRSRPSAHQPASPRGCWSDWRRGVLPSCFDAAAREAQEKLSRASPKGKGGVAEADGRAWHSTGQANEATSNWVGTWQAHPAECDRDFRLWHHYDMVGSLCPCSAGPEA